jgi:hypothetical protein
MSFVWVAHRLFRENGSTLTFDAAKYRRTKPPIGAQLNVSPVGLANSRDHLTAAFK